MQGPWRVFIVEDDPATRAFFASSVQRCPQLVLAGQAASVAEACLALSAPSLPTEGSSAQASSTQGMAIDVLMTDLGLPDGSGLEVIRYALAQHPRCEALVISMFGDEDNVLSSIEAGATGYIHKDAAPDDIAQSVLQLKAGHSPISPMIARRVLEKYRSMALNLEQNEAIAQGNAAQAAIKNRVSVDATAVPYEVDSGNPTLSQREHEVLERIARGFSYAEIAKLGNVSVNTVQTHIKNLYAKLAVHNKSEAVFEATRLGILPR